MSVTILGYLCRDRNTLPGGQTTETVGGKGLYLAAAMARCGLDTHLITWLPEVDRVLLSALNDYPVDCQVIPVPTGTANTNVHRGDRTLATTQVDPDALRPSDFTPAMVTTLESSHLVMVAPDLESKIALATLSWISGQLGVSLTADIGKYLRTISPRGQLRPRWPWPEEAQWLAQFDRIFLSQEDLEPALASGESLLSAARRFAEFGPSEVIITLGSRGAFIYDHPTNEAFEVPAYPAATIVDPTGAGDTFAGAYLAERLATDSPVQAGRFAAVAASLKLAYPGPLRELGEVIQRLVNEQ